MRHHRSLTLAGALYVLSGSAAFGQATRTWVSGVGNDANPCSRTAPCKTFAGAMSATAAGGEISVLDPGGFGGVTITKAITLNGGGTLAGVLVAGTSAVIVNAGPNDHVVLRGLTIEGAGTGLSGIRFLTGASLSVEDCTISDMTQFGIDHQAAGNLFVTDTFVHHAILGGISITPPTGPARATIQSTRIVASGFGVHGKGNAVVTANDTTVFASTGAGFWAETAPAELNVSHSTAANGTVGLQATDAAILRTAAVTVTGNTTSALLAETSGIIVPFTDDLLAGNPPGGSGAPFCELTGAAAAVPCPDVASCPACPSPTCPEPSCPQPTCPEPSCPQPTCPEPSCPQPTCPAPTSPAVTVNGTVGPCKRCRTKQGVTTCLQCVVSLP